MHTQLSVSIRYCAKRHTCIYVHTNIHTHLQTHMECVDDNIIYMDAAHTHIHTHLQTHMECVDDNIIYMNAAHTHTFTPTYKPTQNV